MGTHQFIIDYLRRYKAHQSELFKTTDSETQTLIEVLRRKSRPTAP
jgi:hypothetical protein